MEQKKPNIINYAAFLKRVYNKEDVAKQLMQHFIQKYPEQLKKIQEGLDCNDSDTVLMVTHQLKGSIIHFDAIEIVDKLAEIEKHTREGELDKTTEVFKKLLPRFDDLSHEMNTLINQ